MFGSLLDNDLHVIAQQNPILYQNKTLVLNANLIPLSYYPLSLEIWTRVMTWLVKSIQREKYGQKPIINVLETYDDLYVNTVSQSFKLPSVISMVEYVPPPLVKFTRYNVFLRDGFKCQYSGKRLPPSKLTFDHVIPRAQGGKTEWNNVVTCAYDVNVKKGNRTPKEAGLTLLKQPSRPNYYQILQEGRKLKPNYLHKTWNDYLYWDSELEK